MQLRHLPHNPVAPIVVHHHIVRHRKPLRAGRLRRHDRQHLLAHHAITRHDPFHLKALWAIDHNDPVATLEFAAWQRAADSVRISGCSTASSRPRAEGSEKTCRRIAARSSAPVLPAISAPNSAINAGIAAPLGAVSSCAMASVSTSCAPCATKRSATVVLPLPIPPVRPTM